MVKEVVLIFNILVWFIKKEWLDDWGDDDWGDGWYDDWGD